MDRAFLDRRRLGRHDMVGLHGRNAGMDRHHMVGSLLDRHHVGRAVVVGLIVGRAILELRGLELTQSPRVAPAPYMS